ncbi:unnamed protein product, partial [marine sediment metagenome]
EKAKDLVRMAVAKAARLEPLQRLRLSVIPRGLVIGGGISGMAAALSLARQGFEVYLVEKEKELGGLMKKIHYTLVGNSSHTQHNQVWLEDKLLSQNLIVY